MPRTVPSQVVDLIDRQLPQTTPHVTISFETVPFLLAVVKLTEEIPSELLAISGEDYNELVCGLEAIKTSVARWLPSDKAVHGRPALNGKNVVSLVRDALAKCPDEIPSPATTELLFIDDDPGLRESIRIDISSATNDLHNGQWKAATVVAGSAAEALLFWAIQRHPRRDTARGPNKLLERWDLHDYAVVARDLDLIGESTLTQTMLAKDFRNLIHPGRSQRLGQVCDRATALSALAAVEHIARNLSSRAGRGDADVQRPVDR